MKIARLSTLAAFLLGFASQAAAAPIVPSSYSFNMGPGYWDDTGSQLTNGLYSDMSGGLTLASAYEFVGWDGGVPSITFNFGSVVTLNEVSLSFANWNSAAVYVPSQIKIGSDLFSVDPSSYAGNIHPFLSFSGSWTGSSLTLDLISSQSRWIFVDEVVCNEGPAAGNGNTVPDAAATLPLLGAALAGMMVLRRRKI